MRSLKRPAVTADDLLRRQEQSYAKRPRLSVSNSDSSSDSEDTTYSIHPASRLQDDNSSQLSGPVRSSRQTQLSFSQLGVSSQLQAALKSMAISIPTDVQAACIPPLLDGKDCIGNAKTGSGKTISFAIPILQRLSEDPCGLFSLVLTPTRELAFQISEQFVVLGSSLNLRTTVVVGGMDMTAQAIELNSRPHVVIATPGRLVDLLKSNNGEWDLLRVKFLVLDEADRLLSTTFSAELKYIFDSLPQQRQTCLFTATMTESIESIASANPKPGKSTPFLHRMTKTVETADNLKQYYIIAPSHIREPYLYHLLCYPPESTHHLRRSLPEHAKNRKSGHNTKTKQQQDSDVPDQPPPTIIFCNHPRTAAYLTILLKELGIRTTSLHSHMTQRERLTSLSLFRSYVIPVLVSTDVGARGLDIDDVAMVVNWDLPRHAEEYTHRVGRTARAGRGGMAVSLVTESDEEKVLQVEDRIGTKLEEMALPESKVLAKLDAVSTAKRIAKMELHDSGFGQREAIRKTKQKYLEG